MQQTSTRPLPTYASVQLANIPEELRVAHLWMLWKPVPDEKGDIKKKPLMPNGEAAKSNDPATWSSFEDTIKAYTDGDYAGLGIGIAEGFAAVDIDNCMVGGELTERAQDIIDRMASYTEYSPSGEGIRIIFKTSGFAYESERYYIKNDKIGLEIYVSGCTKRYVTITGNVLHDKPIAERSEVLAGILEDYMVRPSTDVVEGDTASTGGQVLSDAEILTKVRCSAQKEKFAALWAGDTTGHGGDDSAADLALCNILAFWSGRNAEQMDRLFRQSGLMRLKWDERRGDKTYGELTIERAVRDCRTVYGGGVRPADFTDVGNAEVFIRLHDGQIKHVDSMGWLVWRESVWDESRAAVTQRAKKLTDIMKEDAGRMIMAAAQAEAEAVVSDNQDAKKAAKTQKENARKYLGHVLKTRQSSRIEGLLKIAQALMDFPAELLDADPYLLNTPTGMVRLDTGEILPHDAAVYCTKITHCAPSQKGAEMWAEFLDTITIKDNGLMEFLQMVAGMAAIGRVYEECVIFALGDGGNGKSVFFNTLAAVLGSYAGTIAAETLTTSNSHKGAELATLKGKRLIIAAELEEGKRLDGGALKRICSTDMIHAERKYHAPEDFTPSHSTVLYTNHMPKAGSSDHGLWRRIVVIPFKAKIEAGQEIKNYSETLVREAGGAILSWIIEGARKFIAAGHKLARPVAVQEAIAQYQQDNDWMGAFLEECCEINKASTVGAGRLYARYKAWADGRAGEYARHPKDFKSEMKKRGYDQRKTAKGIVWSGLSELPETSYSNFA